MSKKKEIKKPLEFPSEPEPRVRRPETPPPVETTKVKIRGYIGLVTKDSVHLHLIFDYRSYYDIARNGITDWHYVTKPGWPTLVELEIWEETPVRYHVGTTVDLTAGTLAHGVKLHEHHGKKKHPVQPPIPIPVPTRTCPPNCPEGWCIDNVCLLPPTGFPYTVEFLAVYGLIIETPAHPTKQ
jgi:hypothetical protein